MTGDGPSSFRFDLQRDDWPVLELDRTGSYRHEADPGEPSTGEPRLSVTEAECVHLAELATGLEVLELGTGLGVSTRALASTAAHVHTVDVDPWVIATIWPTLPFNVSASAHRDPWISTFDLAFVDADHHTEAAVIDLVCAAGAVKFGGKVVAHDAKYPSVRAALDELDGLFGSWVYIDTEHGLAVLEVGSAAKGST